MPHEPEPIGMGGPERRSPSSAPDVKDDVDGQVATGGAVNQRHPRSRIAVNIGERLPGIGQESAQYHMKRQRKPDGKALDPADAGEAREQVSSAIETFPPLNSDQIDGEV